VSRFNGKIPPVLAVITQMPPAYAMRLHTLQLLIYY
jgi:hypothetical protein